LRLPFVTAAVKVNENTEMNEERIRRQSKKSWLMPLVISSTSSYL
jgi:hypothetical protein